MIGTVPSYSEFPSPLKQIQDGTDPADIRCNDDRVHAVRDDGRHACVKEATAERFGWEVIPAKILTDDDMKPVDQDPPMMPTSNQTGDAPTMPALNQTGDAPTMPALNQTGEMPPIPAGVASANNEFAVDFYKQVISGEKHRDKNIFFSPTSMYTAFSMLYEGARNDTAQQIQDAFGFEPDVEMRHDMVSDTIFFLNRDDPLATLTLANSAWTADWFMPYESYMDTVRNIYLADIESVDFLSDGVDKINQWASDNTNEKIKKVLTPGDVNELTAMVLANAIYFKGSWVTEFPKDATHEREFHTNDTHSTMTDLMYVQNEFNYTSNDSLQAISLPYKGDRLSMMVILPNGTSGMAALEASDGDAALSADLVQKLRNDMEYTEVEVYLPKFTMKTNYDLIGPLQALGITDVFVPQADLSGIANLDELPGNLYVSKAVQDAFVDVNEEGTEAAAVTAIVVGVDSVGPSIPVFLADRPFLFMIMDDESGTILFMGKMMGPE